MVNTSCWIKITLAFLAILARIELGVVGIKCVVGEFSSLSTDNIKVKECAHHEEVCRWDRHQRGGIRRTIMSCSIVHGGAQINDCRTNKVDSFGEEFSTTTCFCDYRPTCNEHLKGFGETAKVEENSVLNVGLSKKNSVFFLVSCYIFTGLAKILHNVL